MNEQVKFEMGAMRGLKIRHSLETLMSTKARKVEMEGQTTDTLFGF